MAKSNDTKKQDLPGFITTLRGDEETANYEANAMRFFERITSNYIIIMYNALIIYQQTMGEMFLLPTSSLFNKRGNKKLKFAVLSSAIRNLALLERILSETSRKTPKITDLGEFTLIEIF